MPVSVIFDFDGTLADTLGIIATITNRLSGEFGYQPANESEIEELQHLTSWQIIRRSKVSFFKLPFLMQRVRSELNANLQLVSLFPNCKDVIESLHHQGYRLYIITSNSQENVTTVLERYGILHLFEEIYSRTTLFGKHKVISRLVKKANLNVAEVIYVGDETRDIEAAKKARIQVIAVSWGFNSAQTLMQYHPDAVIHTPQALVDAVQKICDRPN